MSKQLHRVFTDRRLRGRQFGICLLCLQLLTVHAFGQPAASFPMVPSALTFETPTGSVPAINDTGQLSQDTSLRRSDEASVGTTEIIRVPLDGLRKAAEGLTVESESQTINIYAQGVDLRVVLAHIAEESNVNIVVAENIEATVTTTLNRVPLWVALDAILKINGLVWTQDQNIIYVTRPGTGAAENKTSSMPGQVLQVFELNYTSAAEVLLVVQGLLSPGGRAFTHAVDIASTRQTRERVVVEDYPDRIQAISQYLASVDNAPRQVLIEAAVLQVTLDNTQRHGVNLLGLARLAGARINVQAQGFANSSASPGFMMGLDGTDLNGMIEMLQSNSHVRTLATPKVLVVNGQQARIQIGSKFGYFVATTTQTSTIQSVDFLDIGVVLQVKPIITQDGQVLLSVQPKVSGGRINPDSGLPEEDTTEVETTALLQDGKGMIIGGLIKESDAVSNTWIPWLGKIPVIGKLFSRSSNDCKRVEVIIALTTHVVPYGCDLDCVEHQKFLQATSPTTTQDYYSAENGRLFENSLPTQGKTSVPSATYPPQTQRNSADPFPVAPLQSSPNRTNSTPTTGSATLPSQSYPR